MQYFVLITWINIGFEIASLIFPRPYSETTGENPGGTNIIGGKPYPDNLSFASSRDPAKACPGLAVNARTDKDKRETV